MLRVQSWWLASATVDLRCGMDRLLVRVQALLGRAAAPGEGYVFVNHARTRIKLVCVDRHGVWLAVRRLNEGRFVWPRAGADCWALGADEFDWLCTGVDWQRLSIVRTPHGQAL